MKREIHPDLVNWFDAKAKKNAEFQAADAALSGACVAEGGAGVLGGGAERAAENCRLQIADCRIGG